MVNRVNKTEETDLDEGSMASSEVSQEYLYSSYLRSILRRTMFFGSEIIGCVIDILYPEEAGRFICEVGEYNADMCWHKVRSVNVKGKTALNLNSNASEEEFTDEIDLNAFFRERRIQFVGKDDSPYIFCPVCKWQSAPLVSCINCAECGHLVHTRCAARSHNIDPCEDLSFCLEHLTENYLCPTCTRTTSGSSSNQYNIVSPSSPGSPHLRPVSDSESTSTDSSASSFCQYDDFSKNWSEDVVNEINGEFWDLQQNGMRKYKFISGVDYLTNLCCNSVSHALLALQHCSTAGVLSWVYEDGSESANCDIIKRGLDPSDDSVQLIVCILDISPTNQPRLSSRPPSQAWCCHMTYGFVAFSGLLKATKTKDYVRDKYGQILIFASRSSQVRSIDELHSVITERAWSNWTVLDNMDGQLIDTIEQVSTHVSLEYLVESIAPPCKTPSPEEDITSLTVRRPSAGRRGISMQTADMQPPTSKEARQVMHQIRVPEQLGGSHKAKNAIHFVGHSKSHYKSISREDWDPSRFTLIHRGFNHETMGLYLPNMNPPPSRLIFGVCLRLFQKLGYRVALLELALPITEPISHHGQGREVEVVTATGFRSLKTSGKPVVERDEAKKWPRFMPKIGDMVLARTSNTPAYKLYRAFGLGEHIVWNNLGCNASVHYRYPILGCVLDRDLSNSAKQRSGGVTKEEILSVATRTGPAMKGIDSWLRSLKQNAKNVTKHETPSVVSRLVNESDGMTADAREWMDSLALFEEVLDSTKPEQLGVTPVTDSTNYLPSGGQVTKRPRKK